jgi:hypothetical protein
MAQNLSRSPLSPRSPRASVLLLALALVMAASACETPSQYLPTYQPGGPQGILGGSVTYAGPLPCTENQHVIGAAVFLGFSTALLPPPEGLGTTAASLAALGGDELFAGMRDRFTFNADGSKWCPPEGSPDVTASGDWSMGPLAGGEYEVRGFYDLQGQFDPVFSITKLPHQGDIAGGAIDNAAAVLTGAAPVYRRITLGTLDSTTGVYTIPPEGANIGGIAVTLALPLPLGLPIFNPSEVINAGYVCQGTTPMAVTPAPSDPTHISMPSDYLLPIFDPGNLPGTEASLIRVVATAGVAAGEVATAAASPYDLPVQSPTLTYSWQDVNGDGMLDLTHDHTAASDLIPSLFPYSIFSQLASPKDDLTAQASPAVILQGVTIFQSLEATAQWGLSMPPMGPQVDTKVIVGLTPAVVCLDPTDTSPGAGAVLLVSHLHDCAGNPLLANQGDTLSALRKQFGRPFTVVEGCLPQGRYALNLVYGTGQAWTVPNEGGVCQALEPANAAGTMCIGEGSNGGSRTLMPSQDRVLTISAPGDASYCVSHPTPSCCMPGGTCSAP